jgi:hypothetical protein
VGRKRLKGELDALAKSYVVPRRGVSILAIRLDLAESSAIMLATGLPLEASALLTLFSRQTSSFIARLENRDYSMKETPDRDSIGRLEKEIYCLVFSKACCSWHEYEVRIQRTDPRFTQPLYQT